MNISFSPDIFTMLKLSLICIFLCVHGKDSENPQTKASKSKGSAKIADICTLNCQKNISETELAAFCSHSSNLKLQDRCCVNTTSPSQFDIIGIDLQQCNLTKEKLSHGIYQINSLQYIYLQDNSFTELNNTDFHRNTGILNLSISLNVKCPGGDYAWEKIELDVNTRICLGERNPCFAENITCPLNSHCVHSGIDLTECLCDDDYHGYKCMNKGTFPTIPFAIGTSAATVFTCLFLWCTQRRYVK